jgi:hypothetical protein
MKNLRIILPILAALVFIVFIAVNGKNQFDNRTRAYEANLDTELDNAIESLGKQITLPQGERPLLVIITDKTFLPDNPTKVMVAPGDYFIIYKKQNRGFVYRPGTEKYITYYDNLQYEEKAK